jgi:hypothetical protein
MANIALEWRPAGTHFHAPSVRRHSTRPMFRRILPPFAIPTSLLIPALLTAQSGAGAPTSGDSSFTLGRTVAPVIATGQTFRLLLASGPAAAQLDAQPALVAMQYACPGSSLPTSQPNAPPPDTATGDTGPYLSVIVVPAAPRMNECQQRWDDGPLAIWNGLSFGEAAEKRANPVQLALVVAGDTIIPRRVSRRLAYASARDTWIPAGERLRYDYPLAAIAPVSGIWRATAVLVYDDGRMYAPAYLDEAARRRLGAHYLAARLAAEASVEGRPVRLLPSSAMRPAVQQALYAAAGGHIGSAALQAAATLGDQAFTPSAAPSDNVARMLIAELFIERGDTALPSALVEAARLGHPCLIAPAGTSADIARLVARQSVPSRCTVIDHRSTMLTTLVVPGLAHARAGNRQGAMIAATVIIGTLGYATSRLQSANGFYHKYHATRSYDQAPRYLDRANRIRSSARLTFTIGAGLLLGDAWLSHREIESYNARIRHDHL